MACRLDSKKVRMGCYLGKAKLAAERDARDVFSDSTCFCVAVSLEKEQIY